VCSTAIRKGDEKGCCLFLVLVLVLHDLDWKGMQDRQLFKILVTVLRFLVEDALADWSQCTLQFIRETQFTWKRSNRERNCHGHD